MVPPKPDPIRPADCTHPHPLFSENFIQGFFKGFALALAIVVPFIILWTFFFTALSVNSIRKTVESIQMDVDFIKESK